MIQSLIYLNYRNYHKAANYNDHSSLVHGCVYETLPKFMKSHTVKHDIFTTANFCDLESGNWSGNWGPSTVFR